MKTNQCDGWETGTNQFLPTLTYICMLANYYVLRLVFHVLRFVVTDFAKVKLSLKTDTREGVVS